MGLNRLVCKLLTQQSVKIQLLHAGRIEASDTSTTVAVGVRRPNPELGRNYMGMRTATCDGSKF
jgi:hypothetical protein